MATPKRSRGVELAVGVGVCVAGAMLVYAMLLAEGVGIRDELMLAAPEAARPGETIALRAYLYYDPEAAEGPTPEDGDVDVELRDGSRRLSHTALTSGALSSFEGSLAVPDDVHGALYLVAHARVDGQMIATVARGLEVAPDAPPAADADRVASPLAHFTLGPLTADEVPPPLAAVTEPGAAVALPTPPHVDTLDAWVVGGACVPDVRCLVAVDVGQLDVDPQLTECAGVEILPMLPVTGVATRYHVLPIVIHGPEGTCTLAAVSTAEGSRGATVAHRSIRFPIALATPFLGVEPASADGHVRYAAVAPPGREGIVLDVFREGRWRSTITLAAGSDPSGALDFHDLPGDPLPPGVYMLEARSDALPSTYLAPRLVIVGGDAGLAQAAEAPARAGAEGPELTFFLASHEQRGLVLPGTSSGLLDDRMRLDGRKRTARTIAFGGMAVGILLLVVTVLRRGLSADAEARKLMADAGVPNADDGAARRSGRFTVVLMVLALGLALTTGAALIAAHELALDSANDPVRS
jgi:hypothetical protein